jgi:hypothetical protein
LRPVSISGGAGHFRSNSRSWRLWPPWSSGTCAVRSCTRSRPGRHRIARDRLAWRIVCALNARGGTNRGTNLRNGADLADPIGLYTAKRDLGRIRGISLWCRRSRVRLRSPTPRESPARRCFHLPGMERPLSPGPSGAQSSATRFPRATRPSTLSGAGPRKPGYLLQALSASLAAFARGVSRQYRAGSSRAGPRRPSSRHEAARGTRAWRHAVRSSAGARLGHRGKAVIYTSFHSWMIATRRCSSSWTQSSLGSLPHEQPWELA